jgi:phospho-N-acetylmuramoyl-pentapeptide-transferase
MLQAILDILAGLLTEQGRYGLIETVDTFIQQVEVRVFAALITSFATVLALGPRTIRWLTKKKIGDTASFDHDTLNDLMRSKANTPTMGGALVAAAILLATFLFADLTNDYIKMAFVVILWHAGLGAADDWLKLTAATRAAGSRQGLYSWEKLVFQIGIGLLIGVFAYQAGVAPNETAPHMPHVLNLPFQRTYVPPDKHPNAQLIYLAPAVFVAVTTLFMAGMSNAVNITDGMDGLAPGTAAVVAFGLVGLALLVGTDGWAQDQLVPYVPGANELAVVAGALAGATAGFLWWNCSPASVFMGDTGSLAIGGLIGYIAIVTRMEYVVLIMTGVFLWEIASVVIQVAYYRSTGGKRVFRCAPYHHHLHMGGWPEQRIVSRFWIITILLTTIALASLKLR